MTSGKGFDNDGIKYSVDRDYDEQIDLIKRNYTLYNGDVPYSKVLDAKSNNSQDELAKRKIENPFHPSLQFMESFNNYNVGCDPIESILIETGNDEAADNTGSRYKTNNIRSKKDTKRVVSPSLFSPYHGVISKGIMNNLPLLNGSPDGNMRSSSLAGGTDISDCSIGELVRLSKLPNSILGKARYRYIDFMYCKDLGKIANNHLITLRKFVSPIGDNIFTESNKDKHFHNSGDIGRLVTWFGTDDNKLEDIMSYEYQASWKKLESKIQPLDSQEGNYENGRGITGKLINTLSPATNKSVAKGTGPATLVTDMMEKIGLGSSTHEYQSNDVALGRNYDNNKVYTPQNTIQDTHTYEGKLTFKHEFSLNFSYKLRAYDNINPKSAMLDLLANILNVTYREGKFWAGRQQILGAPRNSSQWKKANALIDSFSKGIDGLLTNFFHGNFEQVANALGSYGKQLMETNVMKGLTAVVSDTVEAAEETTKALMRGDTEGAKNAAGKAAKVIGNGISKSYDYLKSIGVGDAMMGAIKNKMGRPALYAFDSLLSGANVGLWHVTIGNPKNPIAVFGNLILTNAKITHSGPLGIDDFPTELRVSVALQHARSRDAIDIQKMYTKGENAIYMSLASPYTKVKFGKYGTIGSGAPEDKGKSETITKPEDFAKTSLESGAAIDTAAKTNEENGGNGSDLNVTLGCSVEEYVFNKNQMR